MNGPEHFREAEAILDNAEEYHLEFGDEWYANAMAAAQVHATLALTAATIDAAAHPNQHQVDYLGTWWEVQR